MKLFIALTMIALACGSPVEEIVQFEPSPLPEDTNHFVDIESRIVNGQVAIEGQFPWQAFLNVTSPTNKNFHCGASLVSKRHLITAAHCLTGIDKKTNTLWRGISIDVKLGSTKKSRDVCVITTKTYIIHPDYNMNSLKNDIAIIRLPKDYDRMIGCQSRFIKTISLPTNNGFHYNDFAGRNAVASGFGITFLGDDTNDDLNYAYLKVISNAICRKTFFNIDDSVICAMGQGSSYNRPDTCQGDSGGPLVISKNGNDYTLVGVTSYGIPGCNEGPSVYTRVSSFMGFISQYAKDIKCY